MERMNTEELKKELEKLKDFKVYVFEGEVYVKAEDYREKAIENKNLKAKCDMIELRLSQFKRDNKELEEEIKKLNEKIRFLEQCLDNKEKVNKSLREEIGKLVNDGK